MNLGLALGRTAWIVLIGAYITVASLIPVWIMLQPRDYLSSFLLYAMMIIAVFGILLSAFTGTATFQLPMVNNAKIGTSSSDPFHHGRLTVAAAPGFPFPSLHRNFFQAAGQRGTCAAHRLRLHADRVRTGMHLPDRCRYGLR